VSEFVYGSKSNVPDYVRRGGNTYRVVSEQLGSPRYVVNVANASDVPLTASYSSFGEVTGTGLDWMPFGFAGGVYEPETQLVRFGRRDMDPPTGRWTSKEPVRFGGSQNFFAYALNDPVNQTDSTGAAPDPQCINSVRAACEENCWGCGYNACVRLCTSIGNSFCPDLPPEKERPRPPDAPPRP
jgi:RHS repeat-associated protein